MCTKIIMKNCKAASVKRVNHTDANIAIAFEPLSDAAF